MEGLILAKHKALYITIVCFLIVSFACSPAPSVTTTAMPSVTVAYTPTLTHTPEPTTTIQPSSTPFPITIPTLLVNDRNQVVFGENFNGFEFGHEFDFDIHGLARIESGVVVLEIDGGYRQPTKIWPFGGIYGTFPVSPDTTTTVLFKTTSGTAFDIGFHTGDYETESLRRFSFNSAGGTWDLFSGNNPIKSWHAGHLHFDTWHYFSLTRTADGDVDAKLWEQDKPENMIRFHGNLGSEWGTLEPTFFADYRSGSFMLSEFQVLR